MAGRTISTPFGWVWRSFLGLIGHVVVAAVWTFKNDQTANATAADPVMTREHAEANARLHSAVADVSALKRSLRDPSSLALDRVFTSKIGDVVCIRYRAANGFGGFNLDGMVFVDDAKGSSNRRTWKKRCMHGGLIEMTEEINYALEAAGH